MEALDREMARQARRLDPKQVLEPAKANSVADIKRLISELEPSRNPRQAEVPLSTTMQVTEESKDNPGASVPVVYKVDAHTRSKSKRDLLIEGLEIVKNRVEVGDKLSGGGDAIEVNG